jgi:transcriptional regulator with GAF, ATPase, and Fis domain
MEPQQAFLQLGRLDLSQLTLTEVLAEVAALARASVPGAAEVSVTLIEAERARTVAFTGNLAVHLDERQYARGFGPCMDAAISGDTITIKDTATDDRYPDFGLVAVRAGMHSTLSVGMPVPQRVVGGLNLYARIPDAFDQASADMAQAFAAYGAIALVNAALLDSKVTFAAGLERAMVSRAVIEQAKGILIARSGCDPTEAFSELVRRSQRTNVKLARVAADLVAEARSTRESQAGS